MRSAAISGVRQPTLTRAGRMSALLAVVIVMISLYVWRLQDLFPVIAMTKAPLLILPVGAFALLSDRAAMRQRARLRHPVVKWALVILAFVVLSIPTSLYAGRSLSFLLSDHAKTVLMMVMVILAVRSFKDVERLAMVLVGGAALYSFNIVTRFTVDEGTGRLGDLVYYDANDLGMLVVASLPLCVYFVSKAHGWRLRVLGLTTLGLFVSVVIKTGSRGAFLALVAVGGFLVFRYTAIPKKVRYGAVVAVLVLMSAFASDRYWDMMSTLLNPKADYNWSGNSQTGRAAVWKRGIGYMLQRPLTGVGARCFPVAEGTISPLARLQDEGIGLKWSAAHNSFVEIGAELGIVGLVAFVLMLSAAFRAAWAIARRKRGPPATRDERSLAQALVGALIAYVVAGFFLSQAYSAFLYVLVGLITSLYCLKQAEVKAAQSGRPMAAQIPVPGRASVVAVPMAPLPGVGLAPRRSHGL